MNKFRKIILAAVLSLAGQFASAATYDPSLKWYTLSSRHFDVHFHTGEEEWARLALPIAERIYDKVTRELRWVPTMRTDIVLTDSMDIANGWTSVVPALHIELFMANPIDIELIDRGEFLEKLIHHEFVHAVHLDMARGSVKGWRRLFGRFGLFFPNMFQPLWGIEGIATFYETDYAMGIGRGQSSYFDMLMRIEVDQGLKPLYQINQDVDRWPGGTIRYLYGVEIFKYIEERYGRDKVEALMREYSDNIIPFFVNLNFKQVLGKRLMGIWPEFEGWEKGRYGVQISEIKRKGLVEGRALSQEGGDTGNPRVLDNGNLYFVRQNMQDSPALVRVTPGGKPEQIAYLHKSAMFDVHAERGFILAQPEICRNVNYNFDLYRLPLDGGSPVRLTTCARLRDPAWSPAGDKIVAVRVNGLRNSMVILDANGVEQQTLWTGDISELMLKPRWSPNGDRIAASLWRRDEGQQIVEFTLNDGKWRAITRGSALHFYPNYLNNGDLIYTADEEGVYDVYQTDRVTTWRLTRVLGGAFEPVIAKNGDLYYQGYSGRGFDIVQLSAPLQKAEATIKSTEYPAVLAQNPDTATPAHTYSPMASLAPNFWLPHISGGIGDGIQLGIITSGEDALHRHSYDLDIAYDSSFDTMTGQFFYRYARFWPEAVLGGTTLRYPSGYNLSSWELRELNILLAGIELPWLRYDHSASIALSSLLVSDASVRQTNYRPEPSYQMEVARVDFNFNTLIKYGSLSHTPSVGYSLTLSLEKEWSELTNNNSKNDYAFFHFNWYVPVGRGNNLNLYANAAYTDDASYPLSLGGIAPNQSRVNLSGNLQWNSRQFGLRGYHYLPSKISGNSVATGSLEWRLPVWYIERGLMVPPLAIRKAYPAFYVDHGQLYARDVKASQLTSAGAEERIMFNLFYNIPLWGRAGYVHRWPENKGGTYAYIETNWTF